MNQWPMVMVPLELIQRLIEIGTQDIYTDAREYRERTEDMHEAISELRAITERAVARS